MLMFIAVLWILGFFAGLLGWIKAEKEEIEEPYNAHDSNYRF